MAQVDSAVGRAEAIATDTVGSVGRAEAIATDTVGSSPTGGAAFFMEKISNLPKHN